MDRIESHRRIESALSIFVVATVLGVFGESFVWAGQAVTWWLMRDRGWSAFQVGEFSMAWSWCSALALVSGLGVVIGLWRISRALLCGRVRALASGALWVHVALLLVSTAWQLAAPMLARGGARSMERLITVVGSAQIGLALISAGLWIAALVVLARTTRDGARVAWLGRIVLAGLGVALALGWSMYGFVQLLAWPVLEALVGVAVAAASAAGVLALLVPVRRVWRSHRDELAPGVDGVYRHADAAPEPSWREAPELRVAGAGLAQVRRGVVGLIIVALVAIPVTRAVAAAQSIGAVLVALVLVGAVQLAISIPLTLGMARYTRAPAELPGRALGMAALLCQAAALVGAARTMIGTVMTLAAGDDGMALTSANLGASAAALLATVLLTAALGRAARGLGDAETQHRARTVLAIYLVAIAGLVVLGIALLCNRQYSLEIFSWLLPCVAFVVAVVCTATYAWLLTAAVGMPGWTGSDQARP